MSGDVERVIGTWEGSFERVAHRETMAPLLQATAYASYGWVEAARRALDRAVKGDAWDAALEQRLFVETLLDAFEGDRDAALHKAEALQVLPMPVGGLLARRRITVLRRGLAALARAFAHASVEGDASMPRPRGLRLAARALGHALRRGHRRRRPRAWPRTSRRCSRGAPAWPRGERVPRVPRRAAGRRERRIPCKRHGRSMKRDRSVERLW